ncbi:unnamed protein product, partial [Timema podura]|nr:unnamed protein product [Timema podura]
PRPFQTFAPPSPLSPLIPQSSEKAAAYLLDKEETERAGSAARVNNESAPVPMLNNNLVTIATKIWISLNTYYFHRVDLIGSGTFNGSRRSRSDRLMALLAIVGGANQIGLWNSSDSRRSRSDRLVALLAIVGGADQIGSFSSKSAVSAHLKAVHFGERPFVCDQCGHSFTSKGILQEHLTIHSDDTPFKCSQCRKRRLYLDIMFFELKNYTSTSGVSGSIPVSSFKTKYRLKIHADTHRETPYQCPVCPLQLNTRRTLRMHLVVHRDTKAYQCATCGKAFRRAKDLKLVHPGYITPRVPCPHWVSNRTLDLIVPRSARSPAGAGIPLSATWGGAVPEISFHLLPTISPPIDLQLT